MRASIAIVEFFFWGSLGRESLEGNGLAEGSRGE